MYIPVRSDCALSDTCTIDDAVCPTECGNFTVCDHSDLILSEVGLMCRKCGAFKIDGGIDTDRMKEWEDSSKKETISTTPPFR